MWSVEPVEPLQKADAAEYPDLFGEADWGVARVSFQLGLKGIPRRLIACVNVAARVDGLWVVVQLENGGWTIPGGTMEPGESIEQAARRELAEEAGCRLLEARLFGAWRCVSTRAEPHRPHAPHPLFYRAVALAEGRLFGPPTCPPAAEQIQQVKTLPLSEAVETLRRAGRNDLADLYRLAAFLMGHESSG